MSRSTRDDAVLSIYTKPMCVCLLSSQLASYIYTIVNGDEKPVLYRSDCTSTLPPTSFPPDLYSVYI